MQKIITLFKRNYDTDYLVRNEVVPGAEWVLAGEGIATRKWDGTCCLMKNGKLYRRFDLKKGKKSPVGFEAAQPPDPVTGACPGWVPVGNGPDDKWCIEALTNYPMGCGGTNPAVPTDGTYELVGPKIQSNPENWGTHWLIRHGDDSNFDASMCPRDFEGLKAWLANQNIEGVVWHHPDGRMVKIKKRDFGLKRKS